MVETLTLSIKGNGAGTHTLRTSFGLTRSNFVRSADADRAVAHKTKVKKFMI